ncbi:MAG: hypothetical protein Q9227_009118 [Pyrenula ochraceoflavens]
MAEAPPPPPGPGSKANPSASPAAVPTSSSAPGPPMPKSVPDIPSTLLRWASSTDQTLLRLSRLLSTTSSQDAFLSTINYTLYLLSHLTARPPIHLIHSFTRFLVRLHLLSPSALSIPPLPSSPQTALSLHLTSLTALLTQTRTTLRLTSLLPLYAGLRALLLNPPRDPVLHATRLAQLASYTTFQLLENTAHLTDHSVLPPSRLLRTHSGTGRLWLTACRAWALGVGLEFVKLAREAVLHKRERESGVYKTTREEEEKWEKGWWRAVFKAGCWFPLASHYSVVGGIRGVNRGVVGVLGGLAGMGAMADAWERAA